VPLRELPSVSGTPITARGAWTPSEQKLTGADLGDLGWKRFGRERRRAGGRSRA
jgi:hypothetical protein